jgi:hypothetical protein
MYHDVHDSYMETAVLSNYAAGARSADDLVVLRTAHSQNAKGNFRSERTILDWLGGCPAAATRKNPTGEVTETVGATCRRFSLRSRTSFRARLRAPQLAGVFTRRRGPPGS